MKITEDTSEKEELYYIQNGFVGNAILWWGKNHCGYTCNIKKAGRYTKEDMLSIINNRPEEDFAWLCSDIDNNMDAQVLTVDSQYLNYNSRLKGKRK